MFLLLLGLSFAAVNTGNNLVYIMVAWMLSLFMISWLVAMWHCRRLTVSLTMPDSATALEVTSLVIDVRNKKRIPAGAATVAVHFLDGTKSLPGGLPFLEGRDTSRVVVPHVFGRRGVARADCVAVATELPFGILRLAIFVPVQSQTVVYPDRVRTHMPSIAGLRAVKTQGSTSARSGDFRSIREYRRGDDLRDIAWKLSAKRGMPLVREYELDDANRFLLILDNRHGQSREGFEQSIRVCSDLVNQWMARGVEVGLVTFDGATPAAGGGKQRTRILTELAKLELTDQEQPAKARDNGARVFITASSRPRPAADHVIEVSS